MSVEEKRETREVKEVKEVKEVSRENLELSLKNLVLKNEDKLFVKQVSKELDKDEELLCDEINRHVMFPIKYPPIWSMYKKAVSSFWTAEEIDLSKDHDDWETLSDNEKHFIKNVLAFFAASDGIVNENLAMRFINEIQPAEAKAFYGFQIAIENIHCVSGDTEILTKKGYFNIEYLSKKEPNVEVWNGEEFSNVKIVQTSSDSKLFKVLLSNGMYLKCTPGHKWLIKEYDDRVLTENLKEGMTIMPFVYPNTNDETSPNIDFEIFSNPYEHGQACALYQRDDYNIFHFNMRPKYQVPMNYSKETKLDWLSGLFSRNIHFNIDNEKECFSSISNTIPFMECVQLLLTTFDIRSTLVREESNMCRLVFNKFNTAKMINVGINVIHNNSIYDEKLLDYYNTQKEKGYVEEDIIVVNIEEMEGKHITYCFNEPKKHTGIFNGILTGQSEVYSLLIDTYIKDIVEKTKLLNAVDTVPCVRKKADWAMKWISNETARFATRLIAFACVEGIFFSGSFCSIFWLKERGLMPGLCLSNEFISRDEGLHTEFACLLYKYVKNRLSQEDVHTIVKEAVEIENEFINESIPCRLLGMNADLMNQYIKFVADRLLCQLDYEKIWNVSNPFNFMDRICLENKSNFFEHTRLSEYAKTNVGVDTSRNLFEFSTNEDF